jgi:SAM-dependent methyltransferase
MEVAAGKDVLHIGMGGYVDHEKKNARFLESDLSIQSHARLASVAGSIMGIDINALAIDAMRKAVPGVYMVADVTDPDLPRLLNKKFDAVLFLEVIQQLHGFRDALLGIKNLVNDDGKIIISTVNAYSASRILKMLFRYESVHDEHICYFSYLTMKRLLSIHGLEIEEFYYTVEKRREYMTSADFLSFNALRPFLKVFPQFGEGIFVVARVKPGTKCGFSDLSLQTR